MKYAVIAIPVLMGMPSAWADSPATTAFEGMMNGCWSATLPTIAASEIYCATPFETDFVRIKHQVPGPYEMHLCEMIVHHDPASDALSVRHYPTEGQVWDGTGALTEDGGAVLIYTNPEGEAVSRNYWHPRSAETMAFRRERFTDEATGWTVNWETEFNRYAPYTSMGSFDGRPPRYHADAIDAFTPLIGRCWSAPVEDGQSTDTHCFTLMLGHYVRDRHIVPGDPDYAGETIFHADWETGELHFRYYNSVGGVSDGTGSASEGEVVFDEETYTGNDGATRQFRGRYSNISEDGYDSVTEELENGEWVVVSRQQFRAAPGNPFD